MRVGKLRFGFKPFVHHKFLKFRDNVGDPSCFPTPLPDCLCHVSFSRYSPLSLEVVEKPNKCKSFLAPNFFREVRPQLFYGRLLSRPTVWQSLVEFRLLISVCEAWQWSGMQNLWRVGETHFQFEAVCRPKFMSFRCDVGDPLLFAPPLSAYVPVYHVSIRKIKPSKLSLSCEVGPKGGFMGPRFIGGGDTPDIGHAFLNYTYVRPYQTA